MPAADSATRRAEDAVVEQVKPKKVLTPLRRRTLIATVVALVTVWFDPTLSAFANISQVTGLSLKDLRMHVPWHHQRGEHSPGHGPATPTTPSTPAGTATPSASASTHGSTSPTPSSTPGGATPGTVPAPGETWGHPGDPGVGNDGPLNLDPVPHVDTSPHRAHTSTPTPHPTMVPAATAHGSITSPRNGLTTRSTSVTLQYGLSAAPTGRVWYVAIHAAHHTVSDFLYRIPDGSTSMAVGVGPPAGGSGATDDYTIRLMLIDAKAARQIGAYSDTRFAPAGSTKVAGITIHRQPATA